MVHCLPRQSLGARILIACSGVALIDSVLEATAAGIKAEPVYRKGEGLAVLMRRVRQALSGARPGLTRGPITLDIEDGRVLIEGKALPDLPPKRFDLLQALMRRMGPVTRPELLKEVWGSGHDGKIVDVTISRLRQDLRPARGVEVRTTRYGYELVGGSLV